MYLLSLCIPTYNRADSLKAALESICEQSEFNSTEEIEIIISDNNSSDHTESVCNHFVQLYGERIKYFKNTTNIEDLNFECVLSKGSGTLLKLNNDTLIHRKGSLTDILETIRDNIEKKPVIFFSNGKARSGITKKLNDLDSFLTCISFYCTWIGGFCIWRDDFEKFDNFSRYASKKLIQADVLLRLVDKKRVSVVNNKKLCTTVAKSNGGYNFLEVFLTNYISIIEECVRERRISERVFLNEKSRVLLDHICPWVAKSKQKYRASFDVSEHWNYLFRYFSNDPKAIALYCFGYLRYNVTYFIVKKRKLSKSK
ncbi:glycosyltransferase family 2 protein [Nitrosomonadaceae bacterium]|nr:glycosyltransferase family 2 protein [Nitrosomonadaceae bacterium]